MTIVPTNPSSKPELRRRLFKPGDRVKYWGTGAIGTVQPYPEDVATIGVVFDGEQHDVVFYIEETHRLELVEPAPVKPDHGASAYLAAINLVYLTELLDAKIDLCLRIGWGSDRETELHLDSDATFADAEALAGRIGLATLKSKPYKGTVQHRWTGERHGLPVEVVWIEHPAAEETPAVEA